MNILSQLSPRDNHVELALEMATTRKRRTHNLSPDEKLDLLGRYLTLTANRTRRAYYGEVKGLCQEFGVAPSYPSKLLKKSKKPTQTQPTNDVLHKKKTGRPRAVTDTKSKLIEETAAKWSHEFTYEEMAEEVGIPHSTIWRHLKREGWREVQRKTIPKLLPRHKEDRLAWARKFQNFHWVDWVDLDEKYFVTKEPKRKVKLPPSVKQTPDVLQHRSHVPMVMFVSAVARPRPRYGFSGKVGLWRVAVPYTAKKSSKNHQVGETYMKDKTMDHALFRSIVTRKVYPAIRKKMHWAKSVHLQVDGASPHTGKKTLEFLKRKGKARYPNAQNIRIIKQPAQSPDCNVNDLAFFSSISSSVRRRQRGSEPYDIGGLVENVQTAFKEYPSGKVARGFDQKSRILKCIINCGGGNDFHARDREYTCVKIFIQ